MPFVRQQYSDWLQSYNWDYFLTVTFRKPRFDAYYALKDVWHCLQDQNAAVAFLVAEPHRYAHNLHIHGLASSKAGWDPAMTLPWETWGSLFKRFGRSKVEPVNEPGAVAGYCTKYVMKSQGINMADHYQAFGSKFAWQANALTKQ